MKRIDKFLVQDLLKTFRTCSVGYYLDDVKPYDSALASTRMRCYDILTWLAEKGIEAEIYKPFKKYDIVFFIKVHSDRAVKTAEKLKKQGTYLIMEPFCDFLDDPERQNDPQRLNVLKLTKLMDLIDACSTVQQEMFSKYHPNVNFIGDSVHDSFFEIRKEHMDKREVTLIYCGYGKKCRDTLNIKDVIVKLQKNYKCKVLFLSNEKPDITEFEWDYVKYNQNIIGEQFVLGDIMIAPRPMEDIEKLSHSNTKIAYPMAFGIPVVASPVPSYMDSPAFICNTEEEWYNTLEKLINSVELRKEAGEVGRNFIWENYSLSHIGQLYYNIINDVRKK